MNSESSIKQDFKTIYCESKENDIMKSNNTKIRIISKAFVLAFITTLFCVTASWAATHYVNKDASGSNNGTSWANAWQGFSSINWSDVSPGDTVYISGGSGSKTYTEGLNVGRSGSSGAPVVITRGRDAGHDGEVIIDGRGEVNYLVLINGLQHVTVSGMTLKNTTISNAGRNVYITRSDNIIVEDFNMSIQGRAGVFVQESNNSIIRNNKMDTVDYVVQQTDGIYSQRNQDMIYDGNHIVIHNRYEDGHNDGIQSYMDHSLVIRNNYIEQTSDKQVNSQGIFATTLSGTFEIYNNVVYMPNSYNSAIATKISDSGYQAVIFSNTTIGSRWGSIKVEDDNGRALIQNNIAWDYNGGIPLTYNGNTGGVHSNLFYEDPMLDANFAPTEASPAIDAGAALGTPYNTDKAGKSRPQGNGYDIGAYEFVTHSSPSPPQNLRIVQ